MRQGSTIFCILSKRLMAAPVTLDSLTCTRRQMKSQTNQWGNGDDHALKMTKCQTKRTMNTQLTKALARTTIDSAHQLNHLIGHIVNVHAKQLLAREIRGWK